MLRVSDEESIALLETLALLVYISAVGMGSERLGLIS